MLARTHNFHVFVFFASLLIYGALALWMTQQWKPLGDEPHYLMAAHSLAFDRDLELANNYAQRDYQKFLDGETLDPHVKILPNGAQLLNHDLGLPFFLALPYAFGGRAGAEIFLACIGALLAWQMWKLAFDVTHSAVWATASWLGLAFTPPLVMYATLIYPEALGALIFIFATRTFLFQDPAHVLRQRVVLMASATAILPFLSVRFVALATLLVIGALAQWHARRSRALFFVAVVVFGIAAYFFINGVLLAGTVPRGNPTELATGNLASFSLAALVRGVIGWWIDPQRGTLILAPVYVLALAGIPRLLRQNFRVGIFLIAPLLVLIPLVALLGGFWIPFEVGARYFVVALPLLAAPFALALRAGFENVSRVRAFAFAALTIFLTGLSFWHSALMVTDAAYAYGSVVSAYSRVVGTDVSSLFAGMGRSGIISPRDAPNENTPRVSIEQRAGETVWHTAQGDAGTILSSFDLTELTVGNYALEFRAAANGGNDDASVLLLDIFSAEGLPLLHSEWNGRELQSDTLKTITLPFDNPYFDRWGFPLTLQVTTTGEAEIFLSALYFNPNTPTMWLRAAIWVALILLLVVVLNLDWLERIPK